MDTLNTIDIVAAVLAVTALALGYHRGFIAQFISLISLLVAYLAAYWLYDDIAPVLATLLPFHQLQTYDKYAYAIETLNLDVYVYNAAAFAIIFFAVKIGLSIVGRLLHLFTLLPGIKRLNKWAGAMLALVEAAVLFTVAVHVMIVIPSDSLQQTLMSSVSADFVTTYTSDWTSRLQEMWNRNTWR
ncbi:CvpA family protein [Paenibacillus ginsengarvi]|uniref:CvpA family protein n=1 Tax=Paenibacillus ginsengarvi TaxID=400777 RepID=A0A3B0B2C9_9BACL|nr:CvpA family protein [Paenibacillus ginsengarvi]RKN66108.1 CvpA family protein [Paenibacillus ginsengarvi]